MSEATDVMAWASDVGLTVEAAEKGLRALIAGAAKAESGAEEKAAGEAVSGRR